MFMNENSDMNTRLVTNAEFNHCIAGAYIWGEGNLSRIEGGGYQESRKFRTGEVDGKVPTPILYKLEDVISMLGGRVDQTKGKEIN